MNMDSLDEFVEQVVCKVCNQPEGLQKDQIYETNDVQAHFFCLLFSSGLHQKGKEDDGIKGFLAADIRKELKRGARLKCVYCRKKGATVGCAEQKCKKSYHLPCGSQHDALQQYFDQYKSFCKEHRPTQKVVRVKTSEKKQNICIICQEKIVRKATVRTVWSPCCDEFFHRDCMQGLAHSQGSYHFRCPLCKNEKEFSLEMLTMGIHVPVQDASWEDNVHFQDVDESPLLVCHAKICMCPKETGRAFNREHGIWEVLPCKSCGSRGIHAKCGGLEDYPEASWNCYNCRSVMKDQEPKPLPHTEKFYTFLQDQPSKQDGQTADAASSSRTDGGEAVIAGAENRSNPNRLFEALLAVLPHIQSMEEALVQESPGGHLQLTITPVVPHPSAPHQNLRVKEHMTSAPSSYLSQPCDLSSPAHSRLGTSEDLAHKRPGTTVDIYHTRPRSAAVSPPRVSISIQPSAKKNNVQTNLEMAEPGPSSGRRSNSNGGLINGGGSNSNIGIKPEPSDWSVGNGDGGGENGDDRKLVRRRITTLEKESVKEMYENKLEAIIRSRLKDDDDGARSNAGFERCGTLWKDGIQKNGFRLMSGETGAQRKMTEYFLNRKH